jgi:hypothetical protein
MSDPPPLNVFERELLELANLGLSGGVTTTSLDEEMLESSRGRSTVEAALRGLAARGLVRSERALFVGVQRTRDGVHRREEAHLRTAIDREYEDDWWIVTAKGRRAIGLPRRRPPAFWMNPRSGPFRRSPINAFFYGIWFRIRSRVRWLLYPGTHWRN